MGEGVVRLFVTIPRTGTIDKLAMLGRACPLEREKEEWETGRILFAHCNDRMMPLIRKAKQKGYAIITTKRDDKDAVRESARKVDFPLDEVEECIRNWPEVAAMADVVVPYDAAEIDKDVVAAKALS